MDVANETHVAHSPVYMRHIATVLLAALETSFVAGVEASTLAFDILSNVGGRIYFSSKKKTSHSYFLEDVMSLEGRHQAALYRKIQSDPRQDYCTIVSSLVPILYRIISTRHNLGRTFVLRALEILVKLTTVPENFTLLNKIPPAFIAALVQLLCVSTTQAEPLVSTSSYAAHGDPEGLHRPPPAVFGPHMSFFLDGSDTELRGASLDCLNALCSGSTTLLMRTAQSPGCVELLTKMVTTVDTATASRVDGHAKATSLLALMFNQPDLYREFMSVRTELILAACRDDVVADLVCNKIGGTVFANVSVSAVTAARAAEAEAAATAAAAAAAAAAEIQQHAEGVEYY